MSDTLYSSLVSLLFYAAIIIVVIILPGLFFKKWRTSRKELGLSGAPTWTDLGLAPVVLVVYMILSSLVMVAFQAIFPWFDAEQAQDVGFNNVITNFDRLITFISLVIVTPIAEEFIFRGWLYGKLRSRLPLWAAIILVSALFGLLHGQWNVAVDVFIMSVVLCLQRELTGTIYSGILLHMLKNAIAFYLLYLAT